MKRRKSTRKHKWKDPDVEAIVKDTMAAPSTKQIMLEYHLSHNFYPPIDRRFAPAVYQAIVNCANEDYGRIVTLPNNRAMVSSAIVEELHLEELVEKEKGEPVAGGSADDYREHLSRQAGPSCLCGKVEEVDTDGEVVEGYFHSPSGCRLAEKGENPPDDEPRVVRSFRGFCSDCGEPIAIGEECWYYPKEDEAYCLKTGHKVVGGFTQGCGESRRWGHEGRKSNPEGSRVPGDSPYVLAVLRLIINIAEQHPGKRFAFLRRIDTPKSEDGYPLGVAIEDIQGYWPAGSVATATSKEADKWVAYENLTRLGLDEKQTHLITASSMFRGFKSPDSPERREELRALFQKKIEGIKHEHMFRSKVLPTLEKVETVQSEELTRKLDEIQQTRRAMKHLGPPPPHGGMLNPPVRVWHLSEKPTRAEKKAWIAKQFKMGMSFHPDTHGAEYVNEDGKPTFTRYQAQQYDLMLERLFAGESDPYEISIEAFGEFSGVGEPSIKDKCRKCGASIPYGFHVCASCTQKEHGFNPPDEPSWMDDPGE
jgi:hypothetical protein